MTRLKNSTGFSAIEVLLVLVIVGILGFTGWFVYKSNNATTKTSGTTQAVNAESSSKTSLLTGKTDPGFTAGVSWSYPDKWTLTKTGDVPESATDNASETFTITSPSKEYEVQYVITQNLSFGGYCDPTKPGKIEHVNKRKTRDYSKAVFVESITEDYSVFNDVSTLNGYGYRSGLLSNEASVADAKVGDSLCEVNGLLGALQLSTTPSIYLMKAEIRLKNIEKTDTNGDVLPVSTIETIKGEYGSSEYEEAVQILLSTKENL